MVGRAEEHDVRWSVTLKPPELSWPLTFYFLRLLEDDGTERWANVGHTYGAPVRRDAVESLRPEDTEVTPDTVRLLSENFYRYRRLAEKMLTFDRDGAARLRAAKPPRHRGEVLTDDFLVAVSDELDARGGTRGAVWDLAATFGVDRTTVWRWKTKAIERGLHRGRGDA